MDVAETLLTVLTRDPADDTARLALADALEEQGQGERAELVRLQARIRMFPESLELRLWEDRVIDLLQNQVPPCLPSLTNSLGMTFVLIPPGSFWMGSPPDETGRFSDEGPLHLVTLTQGFYLSTCPVTQSEFQRVMEFNPSYFSRSGAGADDVHHLDTSRLPVESVSWSSAVEFCTALADLRPELQARNRYRLPTEAEWEFACRGGIHSPLPYHVGSQLLPSHAQFDFRNEEFVRFGSPPYKPHPVRVGSFLPNAYGLYDMHGNVWEWCNDRFSDSYYRRSTNTDPIGPRRGSYRVLRGGSWLSRATVCRSACRNPVAAPNASGFRIVLIPPLGDRESQLQQDTSAGNKKITRKDGGVSGWRCS